MQKKLKRLSKREIKKDRLFETMDRVSDFTQDNSRAILVIGAIIVIGVLAFFVLKNQFEAEEREAANKLFPAETLYNSQNYSRAIVALENFVVDYEGTKAAGKATFYLANSYFMTEDIPNAQNFYEEYLSDYGDNPIFRVSAKAGIAACHEAEDNFAGAAELYEELVEDHPESFLTPEHMLDAARCYRISNNPDRAKKMLDQVLEKFPDSNYSREAEIQLQMLNAFSG